VATSWRKLKLKLVKVEVRSGRPQCYAHQREQCCSTLTAACGKQFREYVLQRQPCQPSPNTRVDWVQVLILARRFAAAVAGLEGLSCGPDRVYLAAEAVWRQGDLSEALRLLKGGGGGGDGGNSVFCARSSAGGSGSGGGCSGGAGGDDCNSAHRDGCRARAGSECGGGGADGKCEQLRARLRSLATALQQADNAYKDGMHHLYGSVFATICSHS